MVYQGGAPLEAYQGEGSRSMCVCRQCVRRACAGEGGGARSACVRQPRGRGAFLRGNVAYRTALYLGERYPFISSCVNRI